MPRKFKNIIITGFLILAPFYLCGQKLSEPTRQIIKDIRSGIEIKVYISSMLPDSMKKIENITKSLLNDYEKEAGDKIKVDFINADKVTKPEFLFMHEHFTPYGITIEENNLYRHITVFSGAIVYYGKEQAIIPALSPNMPLEYLFSKTIKNLTSPEKQNIGIIEGYGEPTFASFLEVSKSQQSYYNFEVVNLHDKINLNKFDVLVWVSPKEVIDFKSLEKIDKYLEEGGNILLAVDRVRYDYYDNKGVILLTMIGNWLNEKGIDISSKFVADENCGIFTLSKNNFEMPVELPYLPRMNHFEPHPVTCDLGNITLNFPSFIEITDETVSYQPLLTSSVKTEIYHSPLKVDFNKIWQSKDFTSSELLFAAAIKYKKDTKKEYRMIVIADGDFLLDENRRYSDKQDNLKLLFNSIEWLGDKTGLTELKVVKRNSRGIPIKLPF